MHEDEKAISRRQSLKALGFGAVGLAAASTLADVGEAQTAPITSISRANPAVLQLRLSNPAALKALNLTKRLPEGTPITQMLTPAGARVLTPGARTLTKADLVRLAAGGVTDRATKLTVADIASVQSAFGRVGGLALSIDISCCCCSPCCCAAAVPAEQALAA